MCVLGLYFFWCTVKPDLGRHSIIDKTKAIKPFGILMLVKSTAECSMGVFCITFDLHKVMISLENLFLIFSEWPLKTGFTVVLSYLSSFVIILLRKRELIALRYFVLAVM